MGPHNEALVRQLKRVRDQINMAIEDAAHDFREGIAHAEIGQELLNSTLQMAKMARQSA